jgi:hypothetical protein
MQRERNRILKQKELNTTLCKLHTTLKQKIMTIQLSNEFTSHPQKSTHKFNFTVKITFNKKENFYNLNYNEKLLLHQPKKLSFHNLFKDIQPPL